MDLAVLGVRVREVLLHVLGQQVAAVAGGVDQHVGRGGRHRAVQDGLQRLVAGLALLEAQVVAEHHELLGPAGAHVDDVRQVHQVGLVHLDQAQALAGVLVQAGLDQRRLAGAARAGQQHVVGGQALHELQGVALDLLLLRLDLLQVAQADGRHVLHRLQRAVAAGALAVAPRDGGIPVGGAQRLRQDRFDAVQQLHGPLDQGLELLAVGHER